MNKFISNILILLFGFSGFCQAQDGWQKKGLTEREKVNLTVVSDLYGYVRHFYPKPQNDKIDWTKFLMYAIEKTGAAENDEDLLEILDDLFRPLCPDICFKKDSLPFDIQIKKTDGFYLRSHYPPDRPRMRDYKKAAGNGAIQHYMVYEKHMPVPDSMYCYPLKEGLYVFFPIAVSELPSKNKQCRELIKRVDKIDLRLMPGNIWVNVLFRKEKLRSLAYDANYYHSVSYRLAKVIMLHHQIKHFYPYYFDDGLEKIWNVACADALIDAAICENQFAFFDITCRLIANVKDSHIFNNFTVCQDAVCIQLPFFYPDVEFTFIGDSLYVKNVGSSLSGKLEKWARVVSVNEEPFERWLDSRLAITPASTHQSALRKLSTDIFRTVGSALSLHLTLENKLGIIKNVEVPINIADPYSVKEYLYIAKEIEDSIWHVNLCYPSGGKLTKYKKFAEYIPQLKDAKGVIFDVRGGPMYYTMSVLAHLIDSVISPGHILNSDYFSPNQQHAIYRKDEGSLWYIAPATLSHNSAKYAKTKKIGGYEKPINERFTCSVVFLTDANVVSFGETIMEMVKHYRIGTIIGEPTAGTNGDVRFDLGVRMTGAKFTNRDDSQHHGIGVIPDIIVHPEVGKDNVLEYAKTYIREKTKPNE